MSLGTLENVFGLIATFGTLPPRASLRLQRVFAQEKQKAAADACSPRWRTRPESIEFLAVASISAQNLLNSKRS